MSKQVKEKGVIFVVSGPSGSGKTTLVNTLVKDHSIKNKLVKSISMTTRPRRTAEKEGRDYYFISEKQFRQKRKAKKLLEWTKYLHYYYATPKEPVINAVRAGKNIVLCLDLKGAQKIKRLYPKNTVTIFVSPPCLDTLKGRIEKRCKNTDSYELAQRLKLARQEVLVSKRYNYRLVNKNLTATVNILKRIILQETQ